MKKNYSMITLTWNDNHTESLEEFVKNLIKNYHNIICIVPLQYVHHGVTMKIGSALIVYK